MNVIIKRIRSHRRAKGIATDANTNVAVNELNFEITDPVADIDDTLSFDITNSKSSKRWSILQFMNHLDQSSYVNSAGNVSYSFKFDIIIGNSGGRRAIPMLILFLNSVLLLMQLRLVCLLLLILKIILSLLVFQQVFQL